MKFGAVNIAVRLNTVRKITFVFLFYLVVELGIYPAKIVCLLLMLLMLVELFFHQNR